MGEAINTAVLVSMIGMVTVFVILGLVVLTGKILIHFVNTFFPIEEKELSSPTALKTQSKKKSFDKSTLAAIITTIDKITQGKGKVSKIEKIN